METLESAGNREGVPSAPLAVAVTSDDRRSSIPGSNAHSRANTGPLRAHIQQCQIYESHHTRLIITFQRGQDLIQDTRAKNRFRNAGFEPQWKRSPTGAMGIDAVAASLG